MRNSRIQNVYINNLSNSSIFICGSTERIQSSFVGKKETSLSNTQAMDSCNEENPLFLKPIPVWLNCDVEDDEFKILSHPLGSDVCMKYVKVLSISSGTTFQIGNNDSIELNSRMRENIS
uniref:spore germination protein GerPE n=1 Tax=Paenibacillus sp. FSL K6-0276 TaxID=2921450 RepID=UPI00403FB125